MSTSVSRRTATRVRTALVVTGFGAFAVLMATAAVVAVTVGVHP
jgi:hypothetical protein